MAESSNPVPFVGAFNDTMNNAESYIMQDSLNANSMERQRQAQRENFRFTKHLQLESPKNIVSGYKMAGLSPALIGGSFSTPSTPSAPAGSFGSVRAEGNLVNHLASMKQMELLDSQKALIDAQAENQRIKNDESNSKNTTYDLWLRNEFTKLAEDESLDDKTRAFYSAMVNEPHSYNEGSFSGLKKFFDFQGDKSRVSREISENEFLRLVADAKRDGGVPEVLARMPEVELKKLFNQSLELFNSAMKLASDVELNEAEKAHLNAKINEIIRHIETEYHADVVSMFKDKDYSGLLVKALTKVGEESLDVAGDVVRAKTGALIKTSSQKDIDNNKAKRERELIEKRQNYGKNSTTSREFYDANGKKRGEIREKRLDSAFPKP